MKQAKSVEMKSEALSADQDFTGVARSIECYLNNGQFQNFRIVTLHIKHGTVKRIEYSDPYAQWEAADRLDLANHVAVINLNNNWKNGDTLSK